MYDFNNNNEILMFTICHEFTNWKFSNPKPYLL